MPYNSFTSQNDVDLKSTILNKVDLFKDLTSANLRYLAERSVVKTYLQGECIIKQGEPSKGVLFILLSGDSNVVVSTKNKKDIVIGHLKPYEFFGVTVLSEDEYPASVIAKEKVKCLEIPRKDLVNIMNENVEFASVMTYEVCCFFRNIINTSVTDEKKLGLLSEDFPSKERVSEIMVYPAVTCGYWDSVNEIAKILSKNEVSSVIVTFPDGSPVGIITEKDLVMRVLAEDMAYAEDKIAHEIMSKNLISVSPEDHIYQAYILMAKHRIKHIPVLQDGRILGVITLRDLLRTRKSGVLSIVGSIESRQDISSLASTVVDIDRVLHALIIERAYASEICPLITELYDRLTRKVINICEKEMEAEFGPPPARYSWINMGSSGRMEQYSRTDQDNGIIFEDLASKQLNQEAQQYFLLLGEKVVSGLEICGFKRCEGFVMANNPEWCRSLSGWYRVNEAWIKNLNPQHVRNMTIFLDFRHIYGDISLSSQLRDFITPSYRDDYRILHFLAEDDLNYRVPLSIFRKIITEKTGEHRNQINLKTTASVHIVDGIRLFSLRGGIPETSTFARLNELRKHAILKKDEIDFIETAYETLMGFRIRHASEKIKRGQVPDNYVNYSLLTKKEQSILRESYIVANRLQHLISKYFRIFPG